MEISESSQLKSFIITNKMLSSVCIKASVLLKYCLGIEMIERQTHK